MDSKIINHLAVNIAVGWKGMNVEPKLGKMILVYHKSEPYEEIFNYVTKNDHIRNPHLDNINCFPIDINKYKFSIGYLDKPNKNETKHFNTKMFVAKDFMYEDGEYFDLKRAPFSEIYFDKWIYLEEILEL